MAPKLHPPSPATVDLTTSATADEQVFDIISISSSNNASPAPRSRDSSVPVVTHSRLAPSRRRIAPENRMRGARRGGSGGKGKARAKKDAEPEIPEVFAEMVKEDRKRERGGRDGRDGTSGVESAGEPSSAVKRRRTGEARAGPSTTVTPLKKLRTTAGNEMDAEESTGSRPSARSAKAAGGSKGKAIVVEASEAEDEEADMPAAAAESSSEDEYEASSDDDESDVDWEDVELGSKPMNTTMIAPQLEPEPDPEPAKPLELILNDPKARRAAGPARRKITAVERRIRLETHKMHMICLMQHVALRNRWCNDSEVQRNLRPLMPKESYDKIHHNPRDQQFRRSKLFLEGLQETVDVFKEKFKITQRGLAAAKWMELEDLKKWKVPPDSEGLITKEVFTAASKTLKGSRDLGAQLFCALLRSAGVNTRLVSSLQVLPFSFATKNTPKKPQPTLIPYASLSDSDSEAAPAPPTPLPRRQFGRGRRPPVPPPLPPASASKKKKRSKIQEPGIVESPHPVYWIEAWSTPAQKWIAVDPLVTGSVGKPSTLEPPKSDLLNTLAYTIAFEAPTHAVDVTRRYARSFSGATRRLRVTSTKDGSKWLRKLLRHFERAHTLDRDQLEAAELAQRELAEPIPANVGDLKGHPLFALKRHLKQNEVIHPERAAGRLTIGSGPKKGVETIYRRSDVKAVKTPDQWYRVGRTVLAAEETVPLKFTAARRKLNRRGDKRDDGGEEEEEQRPNVPMYSIDQTTLYVPPPVTAGKVPKNRYGNLDVFVPTMVPAGGIHIPSPLAARACQVLGIDHAAAVTGFDFKNRAVTAVIKGVVVASEFAAAVEETVEGLEWEAEQEADEARRDAAVGLWRRWVLRLRIRARLGIEEAAGVAE
ncbi:hypothetical protein EDC01DRAFT_712675, partial [Geopyxis carbonaria]